MRTVRSLRWVSSERQPVAEPLAPLVLRHLVLIEYYLREGPHNLHIRSLESDTTLRIIAFSFPLIVRKLPSAALVLSFVLASLVARLSTVSAQDADEYGQQYGDDEPGEGDATVN